jgi:hypothetical protein
VSYLVVVVVHLTTVLVELPLLAVNDARQRVLLPLEALDFVFVGVHHLYEVRLKGTRQRLATRRIVISLA